MNLDDYISYFESCAANHKQILHTAQEKHAVYMELEFIENDIIRNLHWPILGIEPPFIDTQAKNVSNSRWQWKGAIMILDRIKDQHDPLEVRQVQSSCQEMADDIRTKLEKDRQLYDSVNKAFALPGLDFSSFTIDFLPLKYNQFSGVRLAFEFNTPKARFDLSKWNNETPAP